MSDSLIVVLDILLLELNNIWVSILVFIILSIIDLHLWLLIIRNLICWCRISHPALFFSLLRLDDFNFAIFFTLVNHSAILFP